MDRPVSEVSQIRWVPVLNDSGETIPAFAAMRVTGVDTSVAGETTHKVGKPNSDNQTDVLFNGPCEIGIGLTGIGTPDLPATARYDEGDGTPSAGAEWGVESGGWKLRDSKTGFRVAGVLGTGFASVMGVTPAGGGGGSLTVKESDGTPSYSAITSLEFNQDDGFEVTQPGGTRANINIKDASHTTPGIVSTTAQRFAGEKTFDDELTVDGADGISFNRYSGGNPSSDLASIGLHDDTDMLCVWDGPHGGSDGADGTLGVGDLFFAGVALGGLFALASAPTNANDPGTAGWFAYDSSYLYVCVATDTWKRVALATW